VRKAGSSAEPKLLTAQFEILDHIADNRKQIGP